MRHLFFLLLILAYGVGFTQTESISLSLEEAIEIAKQNNSTLVNSSLDVDYAKTQVHEIRAQGLPQISGNADFSHTFEVPTQIIPGDFVGQPGATLPVQFGVPYNANGGIGLNQLLFDGTFFLGLKAASEFVKISELSAHSSEIDLKEGVIKAYYMVLVAQQNVEQLEKSYQNMQQLQAETQQMYNTGYAEQLDVDRIGLTVSNLSVTLTKMKNQAFLAQQLLLNTLGVDVNQSLELTSTLPTSLESTAPSSTADFNPNDRIEIKLLDQQQRLNKLDLKRYRVGYMPKIFGNVSVGSSTFAIQDEFSKLGNDWYGNGRYGIAMQLTLFDGFYGKAKIDQVKIKMQQTENTKKQALRGISIELNQAINNFHDAEKTLELQKANQTLATNIYQTTATKFKEGMGSSFELITADNELTESNLNYLNALYEYNVAYISIKKALGTL